MALPTIPTIDELTQTASALLQQALLDAETAGSTLSTADLELARSNVKALSFVQSVGLHGAYRYLRDFISRQAIPTSAVDEYLDEWMIAYGLPRKPADFARGTVTGIGDPREILVGGVMLRHQSGLEYLTEIEAVADADGVLIVAVQCTTAGVAGNLAVDDPLTLVATESGIDSEFTVSAAINGGTDQETDAEAIYRLRQRLANPPRGSAPTDYERWALSVPGITRAWGVRNPSGPTTAGVIIMADHEEDGLPTNDQKQAVYDYIIDPNRGPPDELFVIIPKPKYVDVRVLIEPDSQATRDAIVLELKDLFYREAVPGGRIPISHILEAVSVAPGEYNHTLLEPEPVSGAFLYSSAYEMLILRGVVFITAAEYKAMQVISGGGDG